MARFDARLARRTRRPGQLLELGWRLQKGVAADGTRRVQHPGCARAHASACAARADSSRVLRAAAACAARSPTDVQLAAEAAPPAEQPALAARCALVRRRRAAALCCQRARAPLNFCARCNVSLLRRARLRLLDANDMVMGKKLKQAMLAVRRAALLVRALATVRLNAHLPRLRVLSRAQDSFKAMQAGSGGSAGFTSRPLK